MRATFTFPLFVFLLALSTYHLTLLTHPHPFLPILTHPSPSSLIPHHPSIPHLSSP